MLQMLLPELRLEMTCCLSGNLWLSKPSKNVKGGRTLHLVLSQLKMSVATLHHHQEGTQKIIKKGGEKVQLLLGIQVRFFVVSYDFSCLQIQWSFYLYCRIQTS
jgi:hypothetical protein